MRLSDATVGRDNNFNLIRFLAASGVLVSHAFPITLGPGAWQPLNDSLNISLGHLSVLIFFAISGLLITQSWANSSQVSRWVAARGLRIFPGLIVVLVLTTLFLGPATTTLSMTSYWSDPDTWTYVPQNASLYFLQYPLPGVFDDNIFPEAINGSLWTLNHELTCYVAVALLGLVGGTRDRRIGLTFIAGSILIAVALLWSNRIFDVPLRLESLAKLGMPFAMGAGLYLLRDRIVLNPWIVLALFGATWLTVATPVYAFVLSATVTYATFYLAYVPGGVVRRFNRLGDYSYGVYIYAFPMQQLGAWMFPGMSPWQNMAFAFPLTLLCAVVSWHIVEKPSLSLKRHFGKRSDLRRADSKV